MGGLLPPAQSSSVTVPKSALSASAEVVTVPDTDINGTNIDGSHGAPDSPRVSALCNVWRAERREGMQDSEFEAFFLFHLLKPNDWN